MSRCMRRVKGWRGRGLDVAGVRLLFSCGHEQDWDKTRRYPSPPKMSRCYRCVQIQMLGTTFGHTVLTEADDICDGCAQARSECLCDVDLAEVMSRTSRTPDPSMPLLDSSGLPCRDNVLPASARNNGSRRTVLDLLTTLPCSVSAEMASDTLDTSGLLGSVDSADRSDESRNEVDDPVAGLSARTRRRSVHTELPSCKCSILGTDHFATFPEALVEPCILAGCPMGGLVLDPFIGSGTVGSVAERLGRRWVGTDLSYQPLATARTAQRGLRFGMAE